MIIIDVGKSMSEPKNTGGPSSLEAAIKAVNLLIQQKAKYLDFLQFLQLLEFIELLIFGIYWKEEWRRSSGQIFTIFKT